MKLNKIILVFGILLVLISTVSARDLNLSLVDVKLCEGVDVTETDALPVYSCVGEVSSRDIDKPVSILVLMDGVLTNETAMDFVVKDSDGDIVYTADINPDYPLEGELPTEPMSDFFHAETNTPRELGLNTGDYTLVVEVFQLIDDDLGETLIEVSGGSKEISFTVTGDATVPCGDFCCAATESCSFTRQGACDNSGVCCAAEEYCSDIDIMGLSYTIVTDCEGAGFSAEECSLVVGEIRDYSVHAEYPALFTIGPLRYRGLSVDCYDKTDISVGVYDDSKKVWVFFDSTPEEVGDDLYDVSAKVDRLGYVAILRNPECVPLTCSGGGYNLRPSGGLVEFGETLTFELCGIVRGCEPLDDGICDPECTSGIDPDCVACTSSTGNCCDLSADDICDLDCGQGIDPDCCDKFLTGNEDDTCCAAPFAKSGSEGCDPSCGKGDESCQSCTQSTGDCCSPKKDGVCDGDCLLMPSRGSPDPDCGLASSLPEDSCNPVCDGICDLDCIYGDDPDCVGYCSYCGNGICDKDETCAGCVGGGSCEECQTSKCNIPNKPGAIACAADCTCRGYCSGPSQCHDAKSLDINYWDSSMWNQFGHVVVRDIHYDTKIVDTPDGLFEGNNPKLLISSVWSKFSPSVIDAKGELIVKDSLLSKVLNFIKKPIVKEVEAYEGGMSTPFLAVFNGEDYILDNDFMLGNPTSFADTFEEGKELYEAGILMKNSDNYVLQIKPAIEDGKLKFRVLEYEPEESFIDKIELYAVNHDYELFVADDYSNIYSLDMKDLVYPDSCLTNDGIDCMDALNNEKVDIVLDREDYIDVMIEGQKVRILWTDGHKLDTVALLKDGIEQPYEMKKLKLTKAYSHRLDKDFTEELLSKDFNYLHTIKGDVVDLEFEALSADDYLLVADGFYTNLRSYLYPDVDFDYVNDFIKK